MLAQALAIFNGSHTIVNKTTGEHRTFKIHTVQKGNLQGKRILSLLTGSDNESDYRAFAFITDDDHVAVWRKFRGTGHWNAYAYMIEQIIINQNPEWTAKYDHLLEGRCLRCNRKLTHPDSITLGIGPECATKV